MGRGGKNSRARRSARATQQFFSQGLPDGSALSSVEGESSSTNIPPPAPPSSPIQSRSENTRPKASPETESLPKEYTSLVPSPFPASKLRFITDHLWQPAEKTLIPFFRENETTGIKYLYSQIAYLYAFKLPDQKKLSWQFDPEITRGLAEDVVKTPALDKWFKTNGAVSTGLKVEDIVITTQPGINEYQAILLICQWLVRRAVVHGDRSNIVSASPTILIGLIDFTYRTKHAARSSSADPQFKAVWDWFHNDRTARMGNKQNVMVPDALDYPHVHESDHEGGAAEGEIIETHFRDCFEYLMDDSSDDGSDPGEGPSTTHHTTSSPLDKGKGKAVERCPTTSSTQTHVAGTVTKSVGHVDDVLTTTTSTTTTGDKKKKKRRDNHKRKDKKKKNNPNKKNKKNKKNNKKGKGKAKATDLDEDEAEHEQEQEQDAASVDDDTANVHTSDDEVSLPYYSAKEGDDREENSDDDEDEDERVEEQEMILHENFDTGDDQVNDQEVPAVDDDGEEAYDAGDEVDDDDDDDGDDEVTQKVNDHGKGRAIDQNEQQEDGDGGHDNDNDEFWTEEDQREFDAWFDAKFQAPWDRIMSRLASLPSPSSVVGNTTATNDNVVVGDNNVVVGGPSSTTAASRRRRAAPLEGIDAGLDRSRPASSVAANENLQRHLLAVLERARAGGMSRGARRALLAREHQRILASETLAAARGTQPLRPTATRATEAAAAETRRELARFPRFNLGSAPGWLGELERMQIGGLRGGRGGGGGVGGAGAGAGVGGGEE
ncbi:hypothetical protein PV08_02893 [Exophiala spinifera]|uniref:Uncharacterized protein n=1 Tax=Exophiala spinifera TaxID=91928 RepID=A0A0D2C4U5_9EURO|nr:uncharacterized protein PV08_02893 [Exophiala spinifera]KIW18604.1 hypothetical protein PV08_02893 [Exophiala spinifera]